jgi:hypothetical protein
MKKQVAYMEILLLTKKKDLLQIWVGTCTKTNVICLKGRILTKIMQAINDKGYHPKAVSGNQIE